MEDNKTPQKRRRIPKRELTEEEKPLDLRIQEYNRLVGLYFKMQEQKLNTDEILIKIEIIKERLNNEIK